MLVVLKELHSQLEKQREAGQMTEAQARSYERGFIRGMNKVRTVLGFDDTVDLPPGIEFPEGSPKGESWFEERGEEGYLRTFRATIRAHGPALFGPAGPFG